MPRLPVSVVVGSDRNKNASHPVFESYFPFRFRCQEWLQTERVEHEGKKKEKKNELDSLRSFLPSCSLGGWFWRRVEKSFAAVCILEGGNRKEKSTAGGGEGVTERERRAGIVRK